MKIVNFSHPLTVEQVEQLTVYPGQEIEVLDVPVKIVFDRSLVDQVREILDGIEVDWGNENMLVRPAALDAASVALYVALSVRCGYKPPIVTLRRKETVPPTWEVWEVIDLEAAF